MELLANRLGRPAATAKSLVMRQPSAALRGTRFLAYLTDMSRRSAPYALHLAVLATFFIPLPAVLKSGAFAGSSRRCRLVSEAVIDTAK